MLEYVELHEDTPGQHIVDAVFPWFTYSLLPATILVGVVFELIGPQCALFLIVMCDVAQVALAIPGIEGLLILSQVCASISFASLFVGKKWFL